MRRPETINIPAAWYGRDMAADPARWTHWLTADECSELIGAADAFLAQTGDIASISVEAFPLPSLALYIEEVRRTLQHGLGFHLIRGLPVETLSIEQIATIFCGIGVHLGSARSQNARGHLLGHVKDVGADINSANTRIYQTREQQTFHTDSCDAVGLLCLKQAMDGGDSLLVATTTLYNEMNRRRPDLTPYLFQPVATDRRGEVPEGEKPFFTIPVLHWHKGLLTGIYHRSYIESASRFSDAPKLSCEQREALDLFDELARDPELHLRMRLKPGDMQFVYNHTNLHDRTEFRDWPEQQNRRHLLRLWLALPDDRPLPDSFKQRYGMIDIGDRGGIVVKGTQPHVPLTP